MGHDPGYWRFFAYLNLSCSRCWLCGPCGQLAAVFVAWELVGLCSYLLIGFCSAAIGGARREEGFW
jgi:NADH-quinone oxidoreductase subunit L